MSFGSPAFVIAIVAMSMAAWVITTWIRARHGYPIDEWSDGSGSGEIETRRAAELMARENEQLKGQIGRAHFTRDRRTALSRGRKEGTRWKSFNSSRTCFR